MGTLCPKASKCIYPDPCGIKNTNININIQNNYGNTVFHLACQYDRLAIVEYCIKNTNLDVNIQNINGYTGFYYACSYRRLAIIKILIKDARLNLNIQNNIGWTAFHEACRTGNIKIISLFLNSNRKINLNLQSIQECYEYSIGTSGYDILKSNNINIDVVKEKLSKNKQLIFYAADGNLLELKKLLKFKKLI